MGVGARCSMATSRGCKLFIRGKEGFLILRIGGVGGEVWGYIERERGLFV